MQKVIISGKKAMDSILEGVSLVANPVKSTISPNGRTVILSEAYVQDYNVINIPIVVSKDGFRVSKSIISPIPEVQVGVKMMQEIAEKQAIEAGDATSTVCLLTQKILEGGTKLIENGANPIELVKGINFAVYKVVEKLKAMSIPINGNVELVRQVATVCSNGDTKIGNLIAEAFEKSGDDGVISIEESRGYDTTIKVSGGIKFGLGWASQYFINNKARGECELIDPYIFIYDRPLTILKDFWPILEKVLQQNKLNGINRPLMVFCDRSEGEVLATLTTNATKGTLPSCVVEMAYIGQHKLNFLEDIAAFTGGTYINELKGIKLENVQLHHLGTAKKVIVGKGETIIIDGLKDEKIYNNLVDSLKEEEAKLEEGEEKTLMKKRIARLKGSAATLTIGGVTEVQMKEAADRAEDAVRSVGSSIEEGIIPGGGTAFIRCMAIDEKDILKGDAGKGQFLINEILSSSLWQICTNAGIEQLPVFDKVLQSENNFGYNAKTGQIEDLLLSGIIEPTKSNRCALQNAASLCCQILSSQYLITDIL